MDYIYAFLSLLGGIGAFLMGFKILSEGVERLADNKLKKLFSSTQKNRIASVGIGTATTAIIQSSSAVTVMIVGFVNAGILDLFQATAMIMGANIGTTITAQIIALQSFDIVKFAIVLTFIGIFMNIMGKKDKFKTIGLSLAGLGLVFLALGHMSNSMSVFKQSDAFINLLQTWNNPIFLLFIGLAITAILQSSSAATTILISMIAAGITIGNGANSVLYVILGTNIGTCVTALISSIGTSTNAKRASIIHLLFNVIGSTIFFIILILWPTFMEDTFASWFDEPTTQIAMFHTFFNVFATILFLPFISWFVKASKIIIKDKIIITNNEKTNIDDRLILTPSIAISQAMKETFLLGEHSIKILEYAIEGFIARDKNLENEVKEENKKIEILNQKILDYLVKISAQDIDSIHEKRISRIHKILYDFNRESEIADNMVKYNNKSLIGSITYSTGALNQISNLKNNLVKQFNLVKKMYSTKEYSLFKDIKQLENIIDSERSYMIDNHIKRLEQGKCQANSSGIYINLVSNLERAGDHIFYVAEMIYQEKDYSEHQIPHKY